MTRCRTVTCSSTGIHTGTIGYPRSDDGLQNLCQTIICKQTSDILHFYQKAILGLFGLDYETVLDTIFAISVKFPAMIARFVRACGSFIVWLSHLGYVDQNKLNEGLLLMALLVHSELLLEALIFMSNEQRS